MKVKDCLDLDALVIRRGPKSEKKPLSDPQTLINSGAYYNHQTFFLLLSWRTASNQRSSVGCTTFDNSTAAKKIEQLFNENEGKPLSDLLEMEIPD